MAGLTKNKLERPATQRDSFLQSCLQSLLPVKDLSGLVCVYAQEFQGLRYDPKHPKQLQCDQHVVAWMLQGPLPIRGICAAVADYTNTLTDADKGFGQAFISATCLLPDGRIAIVNWGGVSVWNVIDDENVMVPYGCGVRAIAALPDGKLVLGTSVGEVHVRHESGDIFTLSGFAADFMGAVTVLTVLADGKLVAGTTTNEIRVWNVKRDTCLWDWRAPHKGNINAIVGLPCGGFAFASGDGHVRRTRACDFQHMQTLEGHRDAVLALVVLPDGKLASGSKDATVRVWENEDCVHVLEGHALSVISLAVLTHDRLASGSFDITVRVWHVPTATCLFELVHARPVRTLVFLPDGQLAAGSDEIVEIWDIDSGKCAYVLKAHVGPLAHLTLLPGGQLVWGTTKGLSSLWV